MHLDKSMIDQTIEKVATVLKAGSKFLFSVSVQRDDVDDQGKDVVISCNVACPHFPKICQYDIFLSLNHFFYYNASILSRSRL